jgi:hypothetical protein
MFLAGNHLDSLVYETFCMFLEGNRLDSIWVWEKFGWF